MGDQFLREELAKVRQRLSRLAQEQHILKNREAQLLKLITPNKERCQSCLGTGRETKRDWHSGMEVEMKCMMCNGSGFWTKVL